VQPFSLQDHVAELTSGEFVYTCVHGHKVFARPRPRPAKRRPCCAPHHASRT
jgi:hypothetical protein